MRVRLQSYLLPAALLTCLFFCSTAYSEKKNSLHCEEGKKGKKFNSADCSNKAAGTKRDIMPNTSKIKYDKDHENSVYYIVKNGDTLFSIAKRSGVSLKKIQELNNFDKDSKIYKGMKLKIPSEKSIVKNKVDSREKDSISEKPYFLWPLKKVKACSRDGKDGVKSIGIIIQGNPGSEVVASENGVVRKVGYMRGYGKYIVVKHEKMYITVYSNLMDVDVKAGDRVQKGGRIGNISNDMTLHFQIDRKGKPENPLSLLPERS